MNTVKHSVFAIGVALSVTPIFHSAVAQTNSDAATVLLELQTLRTEIADLRDMVERQQFELKKLKRAQAESKRVIGSTGAPQPQLYAQDGSVQQLPQGVADPTGALYQQSGADLPVGSPNPVYSDLPQEQNPTDLIDNRLYGIQGQQPIQGQRYANPQTGGVQNPVTDQSLDSQVLDSGVEVVERSVTVPNVVNQTRNGGAEIIERSVGSYSGNTAPPVLSSDQGFQDQTSSAGVNTNTRQVVVNQGIEAVNEQEAPLRVGQTGQGRPVLAVPNSVQRPLAQANPNSQVTVSQEAEQQADAALGAVATPPQAVPAQFTEDQYYDRGFEFLKQSKYEEAIKVFEQQILQHPQGDLADDAHYWIAEALFINRKPTQAKPHLRAIIDRYPQSARLPDAMLKTAYIEQDLGNLIEARILLQEIVSRHPSSNAAIAAKNRLENLSSGN